MKQDDAVAPVIAAMLVLAVIVTFFAVWNATAIPSMKAQAEVSHLHEAEEGMLRFSSDISAAASSPSGMILSEQVPLGGGDILYSATKSGGVLEVQEDAHPYMRILLYNVSSSVLPVDDRTFVLSNISYQPTGNFWQDQGYVWSHGYVNVTRGQKEVPLEYYTMQDVQYNLAGALFNSGVGAYGNDPGTCSVVIIKGVNLVPAQTASSLSGNGIGALTLNSSIASDKFFNVTTMNVSIRWTGGNSPLTGFPRAMHDAANASLANNLESSCTNIHFDPVRSTPRTIALSIDPVPNVTVIRQTADITIGTR